MSDSAAALAFLLAIAGNAVEPPAILLSEASGELRLEVPKGSSTRLPSLPLGTTVRVVSGYARLETDLPATIRLGEGDRALLAASRPLENWRGGLTVRALAPGRARVDLGEARVLLDPEESATFTRAGEGRVQVTAKAGTVEVWGQGWTDELAPGESLSLRAEPASSEGAALEMSLVTSRREEGSGVVVWTIASPRRTLAQVAERAFLAGETDLRSAAAGRPEKASGELAGYAPAVSSSEPVAVEPDQVVAAVMVAVMLVAGWWWGRSAA